MRRQRGTIIPVPGLSRQMLVPGGAVIMMIAGPGPSPFNGSPEEILRQLTGGNGAQGLLSSILPPGLAANAVPIGVAQLPTPLFSTSLPFPIPTISPAASTSTSAAPSTAPSTGATAPSSSSSRVRTLTDLCDSLFSSIQRQVQRPSATTTSANETHPETLEEMQIALGRMTLRALSEVCTSLPLSGGSEEIQVLRTAALNTMFTVIRTACTAWQSDCAAKRKRQQQAKERRGGKRRRTDESSGGAGSASVSVGGGSGSSSTRDPFDFDDEEINDDDLGESFEAFAEGLLAMSGLAGPSSSSGSATSSECTAALRQFLPQRDSESLLRVVKHFGLVLGEHRDFSYANGVISVMQYMQALAKCNRSFPFEELLAMMQE